MCMLLYQYIFRFASLMCLGGTPNSRFMNVRAKRVEKTLLNTQTLNAHSPKVVVQSPYISAAPELDDISKITV